MAGVGDPCSSMTRADSTMLFGSPHSVKHNELGGLRPTIVPTKLASVAAIFRAPVLHKPKVLAKSMLGSTRWSYP